MDLSAIIVVIVGTALFFGFIGFMAVLSRRKNREKLLTERPETDFSEVKKRTRNGLKINSGESAPEIR